MRTDNTFVGSHARLHLESLSDLGFFKLSHDRRTGVLSHEVLPFLQLRRAAFRNDPDLKSFSHQNFASAARLLPARGAITRNGNETKVCANTTAIVVNTMGRRHHADVSQPCYQGWPPGYFGGGTSPGAGT